MAWLAGWLYRKELVLGSSVGATNYQFKILVGESASVTGSDVNCEACLPSFDDLRFTTDDEVTLLDYWIEGVSGATPLQTAIVWVKVPVISTTTTIFMYSGNASAPAVSNGVNTFLFFDTALSNGLSNYALDVIRPVAGSGDITWDGSSYSVNLTGTGHIYARITSLGSVKNIAVHADIYRQTNVSNQQGGIAYCVVNPDLYGMSRYVTTAADNLQLYHLAGGTSHIITYRLPQSTWTKLMVGVYGTTAKAIWKDINYNLISDLTATIPVSVAPGGWGLFSAYDSVAITRYRNIFARNFVYPEPELLYVDPVSADFTADTTSGFSPLLVGFTDQSLGNPTGWNWDFGDGATSTDQNPTHTYTVPDVYNVSLTVTKDDVPSDILVRTDYITVDATVAEFTADLFTGPADLLVQFTDMSVGDLTDWLWDFGDGNTSTDQNPAHLYTTAGVYDVTLTVTGVGGATDTITKSAYITCIFNPEFNANVTSGFTPLSVEFTDLSIGNPTEWEWDFGDGYTSTSQNPVHIYTLPGLYTVTLRILNSTSENEIVKTDYIEVEAPLIADFVGTPLSGNQPLLVQFTDLSTPIGSITGWEWNFGDSTPHSTEQNPSHSYAFPGMYTVTLRVSNVFSDNQISKIHYIEVVYNAGEVEPESPDGGGFTRSRGPTLIFD